MATLEARLTAVVQRIRDQFNSIRPKLVPTGGATGQILTKNSTADHDLGWLDRSALKGDAGIPGIPGIDGVGVPTGGTTGQVLQKTSGTNYATGWTSLVRAFTGFCGGKPAANEVIAGGVAPYAMTLSAANSSVKSSTAATASTVLTIRKNGTQVGTITFSASGAVGVISITTAAVAATDLLTVTAPATPDSTLADISILLKE